MRSGIAAAPAWTAPRGRSGKERPGVAVDPDAEQDQVEARQLAPAETEHLAERTSVAGGGRVALLAVLTEDREDLARGNRNLGKQRFLGHPVIGFGVVVPYTALVAEEHEGLRPRHRLTVRRLGQAHVGLARCAAARQRDGEATAGGDGLARDGRDGLRGGGGQRARVVEDLHREAVVHGHMIPAHASFASSARCRASASR